MTFNVKWNLTELEKKSSCSSQLHAQFNLQTHTQIHSHAHTHASVEDDDVRTASMLQMDCEWNTAKE